MATRTLVLHPYLASLKRVRPPASELEEAVKLSQAIDLPIVDARAVPLSGIRPATYIGKGKTEELATFIQEKKIALAVINAPITPVQQRNLEKAWQCKVIDRIALILEIFGERARTREGKLQVELAALNYQKSRLVRSWTHLERQRGGFGFLGGPGESQIEMDRRLIRDRIALIRKQLDKVVTTRRLHRKARTDVPYPLVALAGYTNAGKSTLFNRLTGAEVRAADALFVTLDPTIRQVTLPSGAKVMLSDTVGFISNLPTELIAAFRATLEEVCEADIILHVRDMSHPEHTAQKADVMRILGDLLGEEHAETPILEVWNKVDIWEQSTSLFRLRGKVGVGESDFRNQGPEARLPPPDLPPQAGEGIECIVISALTGEGLDALLENIDTLLAERTQRTCRYRLPCADGKALAWLHGHGHVVTRRVMDSSDTLEIAVRLSPANQARFETRFSGYVVGSSR